MKLTVPQLGEGLDSVRVIKKLIAEGETFKKDQCYVSIETDKSVVDIEVPVNGILTRWLCAEDDEVRVGDVLAEYDSSIIGQLNTYSEVNREKMLANTDKYEEKTGLLLPPKTRYYIDQLGIDVEIVKAHFEDSIDFLLPEHVDEYLKFEKDSKIRVDEGADKGKWVKVSQSSKDIFIANIFARQGSKKVKNEDMKVVNGNFYQTTGIQSRNYIDKEKGETGLTLSCSVVASCLSECQLGIGDISFLICATGTPKEVTPSMASSILNMMSSSDGQRHHCAAFDINAACSGWLYGLQLAYDFLSNTPQANVLLVTCETLSEVLNFSDSHSAPLFGDAVSATLISNANNKPRMFKLLRPSLASISDIDCSIRVPFIDSSLKEAENDYLSINGRKVFNMAVKSMSSHLEAYCQSCSTPLENINWVVSHQANDRIIDAIKKKLKADNINFLSHIKHAGNTSSSSIPLSIDQCLQKFKSDDLIGTIAFGGGYTLGATFLQRC